MARSTGRRMAYWSAEQEQRALRSPGERESMDILGRMLRLDQVSAREALGAVRRDPHRGWVDVLLHAHAHHQRWGLLEAWRAVVMACAGELTQGDGDLREALGVRNDRACDNAQRPPILRPSRASLAPLQRRRSPARCLPGGPSCPAVLPLVRAHHAPHSKEAPPMC
jgi:hypothetical protein